ncbi:unnamed protein product [Clonostachys rosea]|uniref:NACHT domain-containing protein n=1 Tax=Bionectria ochroleuca TaxID=29856 RepID=A0ABY6ULJ0_BIOOC|nr:unnamed protein product [Clonostachys rosea]
MSVEDARDVATGESLLKELTLTHSPTNNADFNPSQTIVSAYENVINHFQSHLDVEDYEKVTRATDFGDVVTALISCKNAQIAGKRKGKRWLHLDRLLQRVHHYKEVVDVAVQGLPDLATSSFVTVQVRLANMLSEVADCIGRVELFKTLFPTEHMLCTVANLYSELVDMLRSMITYWKNNRLDRRIFNAFWNPFEVEYQSSIERIRYLVNHIDRIASASHMAATQAQNTENAYMILRRFNHYRYFIGKKEKTNPLEESQTVFAREYSERLRRYLIAKVAQEDEDALLQINLARQTYGTCDFILAHESFTRWKLSRASQIMGLIGGPGSGKTVISAFLHSQAQLEAKEHAPVVWLHCCPNTRFTCTYLLKSLIWKILEQRPDVMLKKIHDQGHYIRLFHEAKTFDVLWSIFLRIVSALEELWIVIDSIHDCRDGKSILINSLRSLVTTNGLRTRIKIAISSRHKSDLAVAANWIIQYTAQDMREGIATYIKEELSLEESASGTNDGLIRSVTETVEAVGGGLHWARAVIYLLKVTQSESHAQQLLHASKTPNVLIHHVWEQLLSNCQSESEVVWHLAEMLATYPYSPLTVMGVYNVLADRKPEAVANVNVETISILLRSDFAGLLSRVNGQYGMPSEIRRHLLQEMVHRPQAKHETVSDLSILDKNQQQRLPRRRPRTWLFRVVYILYEILFLHILFKANYYRCLILAIYYWLK